jgi:bacterioferritin
MIAERILFLGGEVEMAVGREVEKIHDAGGMLAKAHSLEQEAIEMYNRFAIEAANSADSGTKKLFEDLVAAEEGHWDQFDQQSDHVQRFGEQYLALQGFQGDSGEGEAQ